MTTKDNIDNVKPIEQYTIDYVRKLRLKNDLSQQQLADILGVSKSFIGNVESIKHRAKYNLSHINILAHYFDLSPRDFLPELPLDF